MSMLGSTDAPPSYASRLPQEKWALPATYPGFPSPGTIIHKVWPKGLLLPEAEGKRKLKSGVLGSSSELSWTTEGRGQGPPSFGTSQVRVS